MRILSVDTSSVHGSVAVFNDGEIVGEVRLASSIQHSERLFRSLEFLFAHVGFGLADIDLFVAARGPGSFTGLRVGLAAVQGFVTACKKPGAGVSTLRALAWLVRSTDRLLAPAIDARRGAVYAGVYRWTGRELVEEQPPVVLKPAEWLSRLPREPVVLCGDGAHRYREEIMPEAGWTVAPGPFYLAAAMAEMAEAGLAEALEPLYIRSPDAQVRREVPHESGPSPSSAGTA